ncbi:MAG: nucleotidyltransferase domain-containing protein [Alphaproteobacteria bacterium]|nr:nucleotidyltransferase domain-containing protein [Alphaproteobacteria bacterium]
MERFKANAAIPVDMRALISKELARIEKEENVRVIFAIESGSRAWGFPSPDSDYDVRFVYVRPLDWYLSITPGRDVIEQPIEDDLDIAGWDIQKALGLLLKPNPVMLEWLSSPIRYRWSEAQCRDLIALAEKTAFGTACLHHYLHLGERQFRVYAEGRQTINLKKYFYMVRPAIAIRWIRMHPDVPPPMNFQELCDGVDLAADLSVGLGKLLIHKSQSKEIGEASRIPVIDEFLKAEFDWAREATSQRQPPKPQLRAEADDLFRAIVGAGDADA